MGKSPCQYNETNQNGHRQSSEETLLTAYRKTGAKMLGVYREAKKPIGEDWQRRLGWTVEDILRTLHEYHNNVGWQAGEVSGWRCAVDADWEEARRLGPSFLPGTLQIRKGEEAPSLYVYESEGLGHDCFDSPDSGTEDKRIIDVKASADGKGQYFNVPPSVHAEKGWYEWVGGFDAERITKAPAGELRRRVRELAAACLIERYRPKDSGGHEYVKALGGFLLRRGMSADGIVELLGKIWPADKWENDGPDRLVRDADRRLKEDDGSVEGKPRLTEKTAPGVPDAIARWLGYESKGAQAREKVEELVQKVEAGEGGAELIRENIRMFAEVPDDVMLLDAKPRLKAALGKDFNTNDFTKSVNDAKKRAKQEANREPTHDELSDRWTERNPDHAYGQSEWKHYSGGVWSPVHGKLVDKQILGVLREAKPEGTRPSSYLLKSVTELSAVQLAVSDEAWDADPDVTVCANGTLHIPTSKLRAHSPEDYATAAVPYSYDPEARAPAWEKYLGSVFDEETRRFLQEYAGYCLTTDTRFEIAVWLYGPPGAGRSTLVAGFEAMLGPKCGTLSLDSIENSQFGLSNVSGKTLLTATEQPGGYTKTTHILNAMISGESLEINEKWKVPYVIHPKAKLLWAMNQLPRIPNADDGIFRRVHLIRMQPIEEKDEQVKEDIKEEGAGILNWGLEGLARLRDRGRFEVPETIREETRRWQLNSDPVALFVMECCESGEGLTASSDRLYKTYKQWCVDNGFTPKNRNNAAAEWRRLGFEDEHTRTGTIWHGVEVKASAPTPAFSIGAA